MAFGYWIRAAVPVSNGDLRCFARHLPLPAYILHHPDSPCHTNMDKCCLLVRASVDWLQVVQKPQRRGHAFLCAPYQLWCGMQSSPALCTWTNLYISAVIQGIVCVILVVQYCLCTVVSDSGFIVLSWSVRCRTDWATHSNSWYLWPVVCSQGESK